MFLERQSKLLLGAPMDAVAANISGATIYNVLSKDNWMWNKKQKIIKNFWRK